MFHSREECLKSKRDMSDALHALTGKWKIPLILSLVQSSKRFTELQDDLTGISPKVLAKELKDLELNEFIIRTEYPATPPAVVYHVTEHARSIRPLLIELSTFGRQHREKIKDSMRR